MLVTPPHLLRRPDLLQLQHRPLLQLVVMMQPRLLRPLRRPQAAQLRQLHLQRLQLRLRLLRRVAATLSRPVRRLSQSRK
jgi:hypothetical protein